MNNMQNRAIKRLLLLLVLIILSILPIYSIDFEYGSGADVSLSSGQTRDRDFYYHNNTDDQHWFGATQWAVRYNFTAEYPSYETSQFVVKKVKVYFPIISATNATVTLYSDVLAPLDSSLVSVTNSVTANWMEFTLATPQTVNAVWVVVTYTTADNVAYISSSIGGGSHSYYYNTNVPNPYWQQMAGVGYNSEFLVSVTGNFHLSEVDLELFSFQLKPEISPNSDVRPEFVIYNNSDADTIRTATIAYTLSSPNTAFSVQDTIIVLSEIMPRAELRVAFDNPDYHEYINTLPEYPTQIKLNAVLHSEYDSTDPTFNNTITKTYNCFNESMPVKLIENFVRSNSVPSQNLLNTQFSLISGTAKLINYYPTISDSNYTTGAVQRYNWYDFSGLPMTAIGGDEVITGFLPESYPSTFTSAMAELDAQKTFLHQSSDSLFLPSPYNQLKVSLVLRNPSTYLFSDPTLGSQCRFYAALCKKTTSPQKYIFAKWGAFSDTLTTFYAIESTNQKRFSVTLGDISLDELNADYVIVYWIQYISSKEIIYANVIPMGQVVAATDEFLPVVPLSIVLSPNPVNIGQDLKLTIPASYSKSFIQYSIYNVKGQLVKHSSIEPGAKSVLPTADIKAAGVYLIRFSLADKHNQGCPATITKKILLY